MSEDATVGGVVEEGEGEVEESVDEATGGESQPGEKEEEEKKEKKEESIDDICEEESSEWSKGKLCCCRCLYSAYKKYIGAIAYLEVCDMLCCCCCCLTAPIKLLINAVTGCCCCHCCCGCGGKWERHRDDLDDIK